MKCDLCNAKLIRVRTESLWEFDLWCPRCQKRMATESWFHGAPPPKNIEAYDEPQQEKQRSLF